MQLEIRKLTVEEYHRMAEAGILDPDERVELIDGQIVKMAAKGTTHTVGLRRTARLLESLLKGQAEVYTQDPVVLNNFSEPEPDIAVVQISPLEYIDHHPTPPEVYLIIEVADTTLKRDCEVKNKIYAQSGIAEYWVLDVKNRQLRVFREPSDRGYQNQIILGEDASISSLEFPSLNVAIASMLPPVI